MNKTFTFNPIFSSSNRVRSWIFKLSIVVLTILSPVFVFAQDADGDGVSAIDDFDEDNDGITDIVEGGPNCFNTANSDLNTPGYPTNTNLVSSLPLTGLGNNSFSFNATLSGGGLVNTGGNIGTSTGCGGTASAIKSVSVSCATVANVNLGIQQPPTAGYSAQTSANPEGANQVTVNATTFSQVCAADKFSSEVDSLQGLKVICDAMTAINKNCINDVSHMQRECRFDGFVFAIRNIS